MNSSRLKRVGLVVVGAALIALVWSINRERGVDRAPAETVETQADRSELVPLDLTPNPQVDLNAPTTAPLQTSTTKDASSTFEPAIDPISLEKPAFSGTFVFERSDGTIDLRANGSFGLVAWRGDHGIPLEVSVANGVWRVGPNDTTTTPEVSVPWAKVGQQSVAVLAPKDQQAPIDPLAIEVRVRAVPNTMLNVVDATTRAHLSEVELRVATSFGFELIAGDARFTSPLDLVSLGLSMGTHKLQVRAPGYAHGRIDVVCGDGTERTLGLVPGGDLRISIERDEKTTGFHIVLTRRDQSLEEALQIESEVEERLFVFESLEPGDYVVTAFLGAPWSDAIELAETHARVHAGVVTEATLIVAAPPTVHRVDASGLLLVPAAWSLDAPEAFVELLSATAEEQPRLDVEFERAAPEGDLNAFRWNLAGAIAGSYDFVLTYPPFVQRFALTPGRPNEVRIVLPARGEVLVRLMDVDTSERVRVPNVKWAQPIVDGQQNIAEASVALDEALEGYRIHAFVGSIDVFFEDFELFEMLETRVDVGLEPRVVELKVRQSTIVELALLDQGKAVPFPDGWEAAISPLDGGDLGRAIAFGSAVHDYLLNGPGRYRITFADVPGYAPIADRVIDIPTRGRMRVEVDLKARR